MGEEKDLKNESEIYEIPRINMESSKPHTFQFEVIGEIEREIYQRLLGYRIVRKKVPVQREDGTIFYIEQVEKKQVAPPLVSKWGADRILSIIYTVINEQTPFAHFAPNTVIKLTNLILKQINRDIYVNFEKYFDFKGVRSKSNITSWRVLLASVGSILLEVLSRSIMGRESLLYYNIQQLRQSFVGSGEE